MHASRKNRAVTKRRRVDVAAHLVWSDAQIRILNLQRRRLDSLPPVDRAHHRQIDELRHAMAVCAEEVHAFRAEVRIELDELKRRAYFVPTPKRRLADVDS